MHAQIIELSRRVQLFWKTRRVRRFARVNKFARVNRTLDNPWYFTIFWCIVNMSNLSGCHWLLTLLQHWVVKIDIKREIRCILRKIQRENRNTLPILKAKYNVSLFESGINLLPECQYTRGFSQYRFIDFAYTCHL